MSNIKICKNCGKTFAELYQNDLCYDCYSEEWSYGFEVTTEWGASIAHKDFIKKLNEIIFTDKDRSVEIVDEILNNFYLGSWICNGCGQEKIAKDEQKNMTSEQIIDRLKVICSSCGKTPRFDHEFKGVY